MTLLVPVHRNRGILTSLLTQNLDDGRVLFSTLFIIIIIIYYSYYLLLTIIYLLLIMYYLKNEQECFIRFKPVSSITPPPPHMEEFSRQKTSAVFAYVDDVAYVRRGVTS